MTRPIPRTPRVYLTRPEIATRLGIKRQSLDGLKLPAPDATVGRLPGWLPGTIDRWDAGRPSRQGKASDRYALERIEP